MSSVRLFKAADVTMQPFGGPPGKAGIARLVGEDLSKTMGAGIAVFDGCSVEWTVIYDEVIVVLEGLLRLRVGADFATLVEAGPGDVVWLPENTPLRYEGDGAKIFYVVYPVDWKTRAARQ